MSSHVFNSPLLFSSLWVLFKDSCTFIVEIYLDWGLAYSTFQIFFSFLPVRILMFLFYLYFQGNDPSCLREFLLPILCRNSPSGSTGLQVSIHLGIPIQSVFVMWKIFFHFVGTIFTKSYFSCRFLIGIGVQVGTFFHFCLQQNLLTE